MRALSLRRSLEGRALAVGIALAVAAPASARAFTFESPLSDGCHERITQHAIEEAGWPDGRTPPLPTRAEELLLDGLPVRLDRDDPWTLAAVIGVRHSDLAGRSATDVPALAEIHGDPGRQRDHCLRAPQDDGPEGDAAALAACRDFVLEQIAVALGEDDDVRLEAAQVVDVALAFEGRVPVAVSRYAFHLGRALHAVQDSYTHSFRTPDHARVRHVLNYADWASDPDYESRRDGQAHRSALDACEGSDAARERERAATDASRDLLIELASGEGGRTGRLERASVVLDRILALEPGCTPDNGYCGAPERFEELSCAASRRRGAPTCALTIAAAVALVLARRRRP